MLLFDLRIGFGRKRPSIVAVYRSSKKVLERLVVSSQLRRRRASLMASAISTTCSLSLPRSVRANISSSRVLSSGVRFGFSLLSFVFEGPIDLLLGLINQESLGV